MVTHPTDVTLQADFAIRSRQLEMIRRTLEAFKALLRYQHEFKRPATTPGIVPCGLPIFQGTNETTDSAHMVFSDLTACLLRFQDVSTLMAMILTPTLCA